MQRRGEAQTYGTDLLGIFAGIGPSMVARMRTLEARVQRTTARERLLLGGLIFAVLVYAPIAAMEWRDVQRDRYIDAVTERGAARLAQAASRRIAAAAPDEAAIKDMKTWGIEAGNLAIAQVILEQKLVEATTKAGLTGIKITPDTEIKVIGPNQWLGSDVQADLRWTPVFAFLDALAVWPEGFTVTGFKYEMAPQPSFGPQPGQIISPPQGRVTISVAIPVSITAPTAEATP